MRIITHTCPDCGTVVAANELEANRVLKYPGLGCETVLRFEDLPQLTERTFSTTGPVSVLAGLYLAEKGRYLVDILVECRLCSSMRRLHRPHVERCVPGDRRRRPPGTRPVILARLFEAPQPHYGASGGLERTIDYSLSESGAAQSN